MPILRQIMACVAIGIVSGYLLVAREDWSPLHSHVATAAAVLLFVGASLATLLRTSGHVVSTASSASLAIPMWAIACIYWNRVSVLRLENLRAQAFVTLLLVSALAIRIACYVLVSNVGRCHRCGYSLRDAASEKCPECGQHFEKGRAFRALVPRWRAAFYESEAIPSPQERVQSRR